ncbi:MAG: hypothetical protein EBT36_01180 [Betaproteobacteria bacterium]|jgi:hypothetical protein|nr:hypothetical protein [Betaproteobacteria bacterium]HAB47435.1 hypothetical protein [Lautropia sp.]NBO96451.1 hypothetical protein [Betaproteobacteria bacterium]NBP35351.1 hypothetical protein [Betaproteobacteria bacterium]NBP38923.1 hypothetical protein [Betaproteobacteria bacterium]
MQDAEEQVVIREAPGLGCRCVMQILWPSFLIAIVANGILFSLVDPRDVSLVHEYLADDSMAAYTFGFIGFWILFAASSALTLFLAHGRLREMATQA